MVPMSEIELANGALSATVNTLGATLQRLRVKRDGAWRDLALSSMEDNYMGRTVGRFANRLAKGRFGIDGHHYQASVNEPPNTLHGGVRGFSSHEWDVVAGSADAVALRLVSPDGDQGFPGRLEAAAVFTLGVNALTLSYAATCDAPTIVNLTLHPYFHLGLAPNVDDLLVTIDAETYAPMHADGIPTGEVAPVAGTGLDFTSPRRVADARQAMLAQHLDRGGALDHNFFVAGDGMRQMVRLTAPDGLALSIISDAPAVQIYDAAGFDGHLAGPDGTPYGAHAGLAVEPQSPPDAPNHPGFGDTVLRPGQTWSRTLSFVIA